MALFGGAGAGLHIPGTNLNITPHQVAKGAATAAIISNPIGLADAAVNKATGGSVGFDPTPGYSATNVAKTQYYNATGQQVPGYNTSVSSTNPGAQANASNPNGTVAPTATVSSNPYAGSSYDSLYGTYGSQAHTALNDLLGAYNTANQQLNSQYGIKGNELQSGYKQAQNTYKQDVTQQNQNLLNEQNQVHQGVAHAYQNLLNLLGAYGGGSSSVALNWAPMAATRFEQAQVSGANQNAAQNLHSLATNFGNYQNEFDQQKKQLADQQAQDLANNQSQYDATRGQLNDILQAISSRAIDPNTIGSELSTIRGGIPHTRFVQPSYNGTAPVYTAPSVASFEVATPQSNVTQQLPGNSSTTPALALFLNAQKKQQNANVTPAM